MCYCLISQSKRYCCEQRHSRVSPKTSYLKKTNKEVSVLAAKESVRTPLHTHTHIVPCTHLSSLLDKCWPRLWGEIPGLSVVHSAQTATKSPTCPFGQEITFFWWCFSVESRPCIPPKSMFRHAQVQIYQQTARIRTHTHTHQKSLKSKQVQVSAGLPLQVWAQRGSEVRNQLGNRSVSLRVRELKIHTETRTSNAENNCLGLFFFTQRRCEHKNKTKIHISVFKLRHWTPSPQLGSFNSNRGSAHSEQQQQHNKNNNNSRRARLESSSGLFTPWHHRCFMMTQMLRH